MLDGEKPNKSKVTVQSGENQLSRSMMLLAGVRKISLTLILINCLLIPKNLQMEPGIELKIQ